MNVFPAYFPTIGDWKACNFLLAWFSHWVLLVFRKINWCLFLKKFFFVQIEGKSQPASMDEWGKKGKAHKLQNLSSSGGSLLTHCLQWRHKLGQSWKELWKSEKFFNNLTFSQKADNLCHFHWYYHQNMLWFGTISRWEGKEEVIGLWCWPVLPVPRLWIRRTWPWSLPCSPSQHPFCRDNAQPLLHISPSCLGRLAFGKLLCVSCSSCAFSSLLIYGTDLHCLLASSWAQL